MTPEKKCQKAFKKYLKSKGCFVMIVTVMPGVPAGTPDVFFCKEGFYGFAEIKGSLKQGYEPLQKERIKKFMEWSWARRVCPENIDEVIAELDRIL